MAEEQEESKKSKPNEKELYVWSTLATLEIIPIFIALASGRISPEDIFAYYNNFLIAALIVLMPVLFKIIFGQLPFEYLRNHRAVKLSNNNTIYNNIVQKQAIIKSEIKPSLNYALDYIDESKVISERIFTRSGAYLFVGCLIAFIGVGIFYAPWFTTSHTPDVTQRILDYMPRFGALFFVEFIAFFFLKQYRIMLEEYRYYESVKRKRQDEYNLIILLEKHKADKDFIKLLADRIAVNAPIKLSSGETTEVLEVQKIVNQDLDLVAKIALLVKEFKTK